MENRLKISALVLSVLIVLALRLPAFAQTGDPPSPEPVILTAEQGEYPLGLHLEILEDPGGELTIAEVSSPKFDSQFTPSQAAVPNFGFSDSAYWVRFRLDNQTPQTDHWLLEQGFAHTHFVDLYTPLQDGEEFSVKQSGVLRPSTSRDYLHPRIVFDLSLAPQSQQTYYLRFQNGASMTLPLTLWTQAAFLKSAFIDLILAGIFYGVLFGLLAYNLFLLFSMREANYFYFVILLITVILEFAVYEGFGALFLFTNFDWINYYSQQWTFSLMIAAMILFSDSFLELKTRLPSFHTANLGLLAVWGAFILLTPFTTYHFLSNLAIPWAILSLLAILAGGITSWKHGFHPVRFFLISWFGMTASILAVLMIRQGVIPSTVLTENIYRLGTLWMAVSWSLALADRINLLKAKSERANIDLRNSEQRLSEILEGLPLGVVVYGKDRKPNYVNRQAVEILSDPERGIQPDISAGRSLGQAINYFSLKVSGSDDLYPLENLPVFSALRGQPAFADDVEIDQGDIRIPLEIMASPVRDNSGNVESAVAAFRDISSRKQAEKALRISEKRFRVIAENNFDGIAFMGRDRNVLYVSPSYLRLVGKTAEEMIGKSGVGLVHPDDRDYTAKKFNEAIQQPYARISAEYRIPHKDGSWIWVETFAINMLDDPEVQAVVLNSHDISERKRTEAELAEYRKHLESLIESRTVELSAANEQLTRHLSWLSAINAVDQILARSADFTQIYQQVIETINNLLDMHGSFVAALEDGSDQLKILAHSCQHKYAQGLNGTFTTLPEGILPASDLQGGYPCYLSKDQLHGISGPMGDHLRDLNIQNIVLVPLVLREKVYGYLGLEMYQEGKLLSDEATNLLKIFSTDIAQLIEDSHLYEQTKALIAAEERNRLARDLHDSVTQALFSASLLAEALPKIWLRDPELGLEKLNKLHLLTRGALAEMRTMLLELRPSAIINYTLGDLLVQLSQAVASRSGLQFHLLIEKTPALPEDVQINFYRIAQEALNNIVKHAQASQVAMNLIATTSNPEAHGDVRQEIKLTIQDDGVGFDSISSDGECMGIGIMRDRAAAIQASLSLESQPGHGTQMVLIWRGRIRSRT